MGDLRTTATKLGFLTQIALNYALGSRWRQVGFGCGNEGTGIHANILSSQQSSLSYKLLGV
uniref:Uncharacterized protein n=1 Tax=Physcomitrium patens TaxID=3218 RepID=A0A2K1KGI1_PHYPA|nr:hypothetical protein PHYPA_009253 [Physcomitrium patens]